MSFRSLTLETMVLRKLSNSGFCVCMCCRASVVLDTELMGLGLCSVGSTASACDFPRGAPGAKYSLIFNWMVSSIGGVRKSRRGPVGAGGVTAGTTSGGLSISDKAVKPADILYLNLLWDDMFKDLKVGFALSTFNYSERKNDISILESSW